MSGTSDRSSTVEGFGTITMVYDEYNRGTKEVCVTLEVTPEPHRLSGDNEHMSNVEFVARHAAGVTDVTRQLVTSPHTVIVWCKPPSVRVIGDIAAAVDNLMRNLVAAMNSSRNRNPMHDLPPFDRARHYPAKPSKRR